MMGSVASALIAIGLFGFAPQSSESPTHWESDYGRALAATRQAKEHPLLIVVDSPTEAEQRVEPVRLVLEPSEGGKASLLAPYTLCRVDASTEYGRQVAKAFKVAKLPYMAIIDKSGRSILYQAPGRLTDSQWQSVLTKYKAGELPQAAPVSFSQASDSGFGYCPSCQRGWR